MNNYSISLSSSSSNTIQTIPLFEMEDHSELSLDLSNLYNDIIPLYLQIDWGDGLTESFDNDIFGTRYDNELLFMNYNPIFTDIHNHEYFPSETSLYRTSTIQILINYSNGDITYFQIPIKIRTYDFYDAIGRISLINVNQIQSQLQYQFKSNNGTVEAKTT